MPITYTIDHARRLIHETWSGNVQAEDLAAYWKKYLADPEVLAIRRTVVDLRGATIGFSGLDFDGLIRTIVTPVLKGKKWKSAIVVGDPVQFGVTRQYQVFAEHYSQDAIFRDVAAAEKWLEAPEQQ